MLPLGNNALLEGSGVSPMEKVDNKDYYCKRLQNKELKYFKKVFII